jgi:hypothetical protein
MRRRGTPMLPGLCRRQQRHEETEAGSVGGLSSYFRSGSGLHGVFFVSCLCYIWGESSSSFWLVSDSS